MHRSSLLLLLSPIAALPAQEIPAHVPVSPLVVSRSALYAQPLVYPIRGWHFRVGLDYSSVVDVAASGQREMVLDAELLTAELRIRRDFSDHTFVFADLPVRGAFNGSLDGLINGYHRLTGLKVPARDRLPVNSYDWHIDFPDTTMVYARPNTFLGDLRIGAGWRFGNSQLSASVTLPTTANSLEGWGRQTIGTAVAWTNRLHQSNRLSWEGGVMAGWTPSHGSTAIWQKENFLAGMTAIRWRVWKAQALYSTLWVQPGVWQHTGMRALDNADVTLDFGALIRPGKGWPELQLGATEDLYPDGPALDIGFRAAVRWP